MTRCYGNVGVQCKHYKLLHQIENIFFLWVQVHNFLFFPSEGTQEQTVSRKQAQEHTHAQQIEVSECFFRMEFVFPFSTQIGPWCLLVLLKGPLLKSKAGLKTSSKHPSHSGKHTQTNFVSTISIHIGMPLSCPAIPAISSPLQKKKKNKHILPAGSLSDYLTALGLAWQPVKGGWGRRRDERGRRREELARDEVHGSVCVFVYMDFHVLCAHMHEHMFVDALKA